MQKLIYIANLRLPTEKAYGIQIAKMCEAFAILGLKVQLLVPKRKNPIGKNIYDYYGIKNNFSIKRVLSFDFYLPGRLDKIAVVIKSYWSAIALFFNAVLNDYDFIYSRDELPLYFLSFFKKNLIFEAHNFSKNRKIFYNRFRKSNIKTVVISEGLKKEFIKCGFSPSNILVAFDGVDLEKFNSNISKDEARVQTSLPADKKIIMYSGQLYSWKGVDLLVEAAQELGDNFLVVVVGGAEHDIIRLKTADKLKRVRFEGFKEHRNISTYLRAADILVLPNKKGNDISEFYTSPLKLFEYMTSGKPIIASDLPSLREVLNDSNAFFFKPNDWRALKNVIDLVYNSGEEAMVKAQQALADVVEYTWDRRAKDIIEFVSF